MYLHQCTEYDDAYNSAVRNHELWRSWESPD